MHISFNVNFAKLICCILTIIYVVEESATKKVKLDHELDKSDLKAEDEIQDSRNHGIARVKAEYVY